MPTVRKMKVARPTERCGLRIAVPVREKRRKVAKVKSEEEVSQVALRAFVP